MYCTYVLYIQYTGLERRESMVPSACALSARCCFATLRGGKKRRDEMVGRWYGVGASRFLGSSELGVGAGGPGVSYLISYCGL